MDNYLPSKSDIASFREWLKKIPYLDQDVDDSVISAFIQGAKGRMEKAKSTFDAHHQIRIKYPEMFANLDPLDPEILNNSKAGYMAFAPSLSEDGCLVAFAAITDANVPFNVSAYHRELQICLLRALEDPKFPVKFGSKWSGRMILVLDSKLNRMQHHAYTLPMARGLVEHLTTAVPLRLAAIHVVNVPSVTEKFLNVLVKPLMKKKLANRINLYSDASGLLKKIGKEAVIKDFGGLLPTGQELCDQLHADNLAFREHILGWEEKMKKLEKLRPQNQEEIIMGSFKKLDID